MTDPLQSFELIYGMIELLMEACGSSGAVEAMFDLCDRDGDGQIDYEEFASSVHSLP